MAPLKEPGAFNERRFSQLVCRGGLYSVTEIRPSVHSSGKGRDFSYGQQSVG